MLVTVKSCNTIFRKCFKSISVFFAPCRNGRTGKSIRQRIKKSFRRKSSRNADRANSKKVSTASAVSAVSANGVVGHSDKAVEEAGEVVKLARKPTVKFNK